MKKKLLVFIPIVFLFTNCVLSRMSLYQIELHDENDKVIEQVDDLQYFALTLIDDCERRWYEGEIELKEAENGKGWHQLSFALGHTHSERIMNSRVATHKEELKKTGILIVDLKDRYKTVKIYPLIEHFSDHTIVVKLEKKTP